MVGCTLKCKFVYRRYKFHHAHANIRKCGKNEKQFQTKDEYYSNFLHGINKYLNKKKIQ